MIFQEEQHTENRPIARIAAPGQGLGVRIVAMDQDLGVRIAAVWPRWQSDE